MVVLEAALAGAPPTASIKFKFKNSRSGSSISGPFHCEKVSDHLRDVSVNLYFDKLNFTIPFPIPVTQPALETASHQIKDALIEIYRREKIQLQYDHGGPRVLDYQSPSLSGWGERDLHDLMQKVTKFDPPPMESLWRIWVFITDQFHLNSSRFATLAGYSFDNIGDRHRQGVALFLNDARFTGLDTPSGNDYQNGVNAFLFALAHELGHGFGLAHSEGLPDLMNDDITLACGGDDKAPDWRQFEWKFNAHDSHILRHGAWVDVAPGSYGAAHPYAAIGTTVTPGLELRIRSQKTFLCLEPLEIEVRLRYTVAEKSVDIYPAFRPEAGVVSYRICPSGSRKWFNFCGWARYNGQIKKATLQCTPLSSYSGQDRISGFVPLLYGTSAISLLEEGEYKIQALYRDSARQVALSNVHSIKVVGSEHSWVKNLRSKSPSFQRSVLEFYHLNGSRDERFGPVRELLGQMLMQIADTIAGVQDKRKKYRLQLLGTKLARLLGIAHSLHRWEIPPEKGLAALQHSPPSENDYSEAVKKLNTCIEFFQQKTRSKRQNFAYRRVVEEQVKLLEKTKQQIGTIRIRLENDLNRRGVTQNVLDELRTNLFQQTSI